LPNVSPERQAKKLSVGESLDELQEKLNAAIKAEQHKEAAKLRDEIQTVKG
jgi:protein-arginine kinase activator protein McsA